MKLKTLLQYVHSQLFLLFILHLDPPKAAKFSSRYSHRRTLVSEDSALCNLSCKCDASERHPPLIYLMIIGLEEGLGRVRRVWVGPSYKEWSQFEGCIVFSTDLAQSQVNVHFPVMITSRHIKREVDVDNNGVKAAH